MFIHEDLSNYKKYLHKIENNLKQCGLFRSIKSRDLVGLGFRFAHFDVVDQKLRRNRYDALTKNVRLVRSIPGSN